MTRHAGTAAPVPAEEPDREHGAGRARARWVTPTAVLIAGAVVVLVAVAAGAAPYTALENTDPGPGVRLGAPLLRLVADLAATACVGSLVFALCFTDGPDADRSGTDPVDRGDRSWRARAAVAGAGAWAAVWGAAALVMVPVDIADLGAAALFGQTPVSGVSSSPGLFAVMAAMEEPLAWLAAAVLALLTAAGCGATALGVRWGLRRPWVAGLLGLAILAVTVPLVAAHSASQTDHDIATDALVVHVVAAVVWVGACGALLHPGWRDPRRLGTQLRRYRRLALGASLLVAATGLVDGLVLAPAGTWFRSGYGWVLSGITVLTVLLLVAGARGRRTAAARANARAPAATTGSAVASPLLVVAALEALVLGAVMGLSVALTHLAPPAFLRAADIQQTLLGYDLGGPPTPWRLLTAWRIDVWFGPLALLLAGVYLAGVRRVRARGERWPPGRTGTWVAGCVVMVLVTCSGIGRYAEAMESVGMVRHTVLAMVVPVLLGLGAPLTLLRAAVPPARPEDLPGPREWVEDLVGSAATRTVTRPPVAWALFVGAPLALYFTPLVDAAARFHWAHQALDLAFLALGMVFAWVTLGSDPTPRALPTSARLAVLVAAMPVHAVFAALVTAAPWVIGNGDAGANTYSSLALPWVGGHLLADQRTAGAIALALGEAAMLLALVAVLRPAVRRRGGAFGDGDDAVSPRSCPVTTPDRGSGAGAGCSTPPGTRTAPSRPTRSPG